MNNKKKFIITIDNEEDNQWNPLAEETTENAKYLRRFQNLCNKYEYKPVYLTTYNMAKNAVFEDLAKEALENNQCEIGMHLHAWSTPPEYNLKSVTTERAYLIEYPIEVMEEKIKIINDVLTSKFGEIVTHRSGRWALNSNYLELLKKYGYKCDCSVTPGISWASNLGATGIGGSDYTKEQNSAYEIINGILEVPVTIHKLRYFEKNAIKSVKTLARESSHLIRGKDTWLRPSFCSLYQMTKLLDYIKKSEKDYAMFMIHSSELMPGGSPYYKDEKAVELLYNQLEKLFDYAKNDFEGCTLKEYVQNRK